MRDTVFQTFTIPGAGGGDTPPLVIARGGTNVSVRVIVRNAGAVPLFYAGSDQDVITTEGPSSKAFRHAPGENDVVLVLAPSQPLYAVGSVPGGRASVSISEALPLL